MLEIGPGWIWPGLKLLKQNSHMDLIIAGYESEQQQAALDQARQLGVRSRVSVAHLGILITVVTFGVNYSSKITRDTTNHDKMIEALNEKIVQDKKNQKETIEMMEKLYNKLGKEEPNEFND